MEATSAAKAEVARGQANHAAGAELTRGQGHPCRQGRARLWLGHSSHRGGARLWPGPPMPPTSSSSPTSILLSSSSTLPTLSLSLRARAKRHRAVVDLLPAAAVLIHECRYNPSPSSPLALPRPPLGAGTPLLHAPPPEPARRRAARLRVADTHGWRFLAHYLLRGHHLRCNAGTGVLPL